MVDPLGSPGKRFNKVAGSEKIKSAISKAIRALKSRNPSKEKPKSNQIKQSNFILNKLNGVQMQQ